ncbi:MAG: capsule biosynthesis protein [Aeromonadaceae bacterium]
MKNVLLLQGPIGPFFQDFAAFLKQRGLNVYRIHFNGGDALYRGKGENFDYLGDPKAWPRYLAHFLKQHQIDALFCYGDCRYYHKQAKLIAKRLAIPFWVFEEGYLRPDFITLELGGANANSPWFEHRRNLHWLTPQEENGAVVTPVGQTFGRRIYHAMRYYWAMEMQKSRFRNYRHHRPHSFLREAISWLNSGWVKLHCQMRDAWLMQTMSEHQGNVFLVPLQVAEDFQIREHSPFADVQSFIQQVITSFANHAATDQILLFKHHPMDRGHISYQAFITTLSKRLGIAERVFYGHELPLPPLYPLCRGVVTINSTVGISALLKGVPTLNLGQALYDIPGLTSQCTLDEFWHTQTPVDRQLFGQFRQFLLHYSQINGSFYRETAYTCSAIWRYLQQGKRSEVHAPAKITASKHHHQTSL